MFIIGKHQNGLCVSCGKELFTFLHSAVFNKETEELCKKIEGPKIDPIGF